MALPGPVSIVSEVAGFLNATLSKSPPGLSIFEKPLVGLPSSISRMCCIPPLGSLNTRALTVVVSMIGERPV